MFLVNTTFHFLSFPSPLIAHLYSLLEAMGYKHPGSEMFEGDNFVSDSERQDDDVFTKTKRD